MNKLVFILCISLSCILNADLDQLALKYGTDKSSKWHNYTPVYEKYFSPIRHKSLRILEIGFFKGASARMWESYFPKSDLFFIDINKKLVDKYSIGLSKRCKCFVFDQSNTKSLSSFLDQVKTQFDIIIDDGGHTMDQQIKSFKNLFSSLKSGGIYIIEDLHTSYWKKNPFNNVDYGSNGSIKNPKSSKNSAINFFLDLVHDVNYVGAKTACADFKKGSKNLELNSYQAEIESIHFYSSICFILKR